MKSIICIAVAVESRLAARVFLVWARLSSEPTNNQPASDVENRLSFVSGQLVGLVFNFDSLPFYEFQISKVQPSVANSVRVLFGPTRQTRGLPEQI